MDIVQYANRIGYRMGSSRNIDELSSILLSHMTHVPFENLDVIRKRPIYLNVRSIYEKIVTQKRGGYCYELNGLLHWFLSELGYDASMVSATVRRPDGKWAPKDGTHAALIVRLPEPFLVDAGFGDSTVTPVPLSGTPVTDVSGTYHTEETEPGIYHLIVNRDGRERVLYRFDTEAKRLIDFHEGCVFNQVSPDSTFTHTDIVTMATPEGRITLRDHIFTVTNHGKKSERELSASEKEEMLLNSFNLRL